MFGIVTTGILLDSVKQRKIITPVHNKAKHKKNICLSTD
jgi:hypothetical protein